MIPDTQHTIYTEAEQANIDRVTGGWTSVEERLPNEHIRVLLTNNINARTAQGQYSHIWIGFLIKSFRPEMTGKYVSFDEGDHRIENITHWMPLPLPPEG